MHIENRGVWCITCLWKLMKKYQSLHKRIVTLRTIYTMKTQTHHKQAFKKSTSNWIEHTKHQTKVIWVLGLVTMACIGQVLFEGFMLWWDHKNVFYENTWVRLCWVWCDFTFRLTIFVEEIPRTLQDDITTSTRVSYAFSWSYSPSKYLSY